jgi:hypothetical protein
LQGLTARRVSVLILHHPRKGDPPLGQAARGSGALSGYADILLEMRRVPNAADDDRRRRLYGFSRFPETPRQLVIEWSAACCRGRASRSSLAFTSPRSAFAAR